MLMVRLQRIGKRGQAHFRIIVTEHTSRPKGEFLELLGTYNPHQKQFQAKKDRIEYWISKGAQVSPTVNNLMVNYKVWNKPKMQSWKPKRKAQTDSPKTESAPAPSV
ncbi:MAG: 30S ribosomal protein S16 [Candidatus Yanofskybacteria bacterium RIFCSPLOWO2_01_FULL_44_22]|uniref:Small ribosomal subunit protein bS16 n=2 Tax=Candidatus Yanofskyibacteriota TaxID=1752733 RepID=A0A1F8GKL8_9BACT|nr:MAG: 30S ribosomal protein S16 [Candidatus Yanofskybacteria bacterium RIFCSPLOWO2_01_FULL_44_22]